MDSQTREEYIRELTNKIFEEYKQSFIDLANYDRQETKEVV